MKAVPLNVVVSPLVSYALQENKAVVALESTVITHGLPYPKNLKIWRELEELVFSVGAVPATIIVLEGIAHIGLDNEQIQRLTTALQENQPFKKLGSRDLALACVKGFSGGTTVSATMLLARQAGIEVFATGGIGGVHRDWERTLDISSDLTALSRIPMAVVCAGCKAILDVPATLEYLETMAVPVLGWQTDRFPLFYTHDSDYPVERLDDPREFQRFWKQHLDLGGKGVLIANPIPKEHSLPAEKMEAVIQAAIGAAREQGIKGKSLTPFLLDFLARHTEGVSVEANLALLRNNVLLAAKLAQSLQERI